MAHPKLMEAAGTSYAELFIGWLLLTALFTLCEPAVAQSRFFDSLDVNVGISSTDQLNVGARYRFHQNNIGMNLGSILPGMDGRWNMLTMSISYYRHLWGRSQFTHQRPWFVKPAMSYEASRMWLTPMQVLYARTATAKLYLGCDFNFSSQLGMSFSLGPALTFYHRSYTGTLVDPRIDGGFDVLFYYRLKEW